MHAHIAAKRTGLCMLVHEQPRSVHGHDAGTARAHASPTPANRRHRHRLYMPLLIAGGDRAATIWLAILLHEYIIIYLLFLIHPSQQTLREHRSQTQT